MTLAEARRAGLQTAFLCHSHKDADLVQGILTIFSESAWNVYVDWADAAMPDKPTRETAERIQQKIRELNLFLFLATPNSVASRWCPWEIGFADGNKPTEKIIVIPTIDSSGAWYGNEYLQLYRSLDRDSVAGLAVRDPGKTQGIRVQSL